VSPIAEISISSHERLRVKLVQYALKSMFAGSDAPSFTPTLLLINVAIFYSSSFFVGVAGLSAFG
jgi:hypothetical protein